MRAVGVDRSGHTGAVRLIERFRALSARTFARLVTVATAVAFVLLFAFGYGALHLSYDAASSVAALVASVCAGGALRLRKTVPEDPVWLLFWAPIGTAIAVTGSACKLVAQSDRVPSVVSALAAVGFYVLPIVVAFVVGRARLATVPPSSRAAIESRFRRRAFGVRPEFLRRVGIGVAVVVGCYAVFVVIALAAGWLRGR